MIGAQSEVQIEAPSKSAIVRATGIALLVALLLLFTVMLPAEYGIDPLKTGAALGLTGISKAGEMGGRATATPTSGQNGIYTAQSRIYKVDSEGFALAPGEGVEMKYHMQKNQQGCSYSSLTAPSTGIHGWFWHNKGNKEVQFRLTVAGFFDLGKMHVDGKPEDVPVEDAK